MTPEEANAAVAGRDIVRLFSAHDPTDTYAVGQIISYSIVPTVTVELPDGSRISWRHDLAEVIAKGDA